MYRLPHSITSHQSVMASTEIRQLCQAQIDRLSEKLSALDVWLIYWDKLANKHDTLTCRCHSPTYDQITSYLEPERWITKNLPFLELTPLALDSSESWVYICGLRQTDTQCEYLLLWTEEHISNLQKNLIEEYAQLLQQYLTLYQENLRQQATIQLLEETLQQSAHQLRNPLALMGLYAENLVRGADNDSQKHQADCIRRTAETLSTQLGDLLNCSKQACLNKEDHNLLTLLQHVMTLLAPQLDRKQVTIVTPTQPVHLVVDGWQIEQVLQNLLDNAIHFTPVGGAITVGCQVSHDGVLVTVCDQGPGLGGIDSDQLFTPFYTQRSGGTGLGLAIAKKIILDHQGSISAETLPQGGAQFAFFLPH